MPPNRGVRFTNAATLNPKEHDVVLQTLNQWRDIQTEDGKKRPAYYTDKHFKATETLWPGIPIIRTKIGHPKTPVRTDILKALAECEGIVVGSINEAAVKKEGTTRFEGVIEIDDPETEEMHQKGTLTLSTAFYSQFDDIGRLNQDVIPDHVIIFEPTETFRPQDQGAMFLNAVSEPTPNPLGSMMGKVRTLLTNAISALSQDDSLDSTRQRILTAIQAEEIGINSGSPGYVWIEALFPGSVVYRVENAETGNGLYRRDYTDGPGGVSLGDSTKVKVVYVPEDQETVPPSSGSGEVLPIDGKPGMQVWTKNATNPEMNAGGNSARSGSGVETLPDTPTPDLSATIGEQEKKIQNLGAEILQYKEQIKVFEEAEKKREAALKDERWNEAKAEYLRPGDYKEPADEAKLREQFENDPYSFFKNAIAIKREPDRKKEGAEFLKNAANPDELGEVDDIVAEMRQTTGRRLKK